MKKGWHGVDAVLFDLANTLVNFSSLKVAAILTEGAQDTYAHLQQLGVPLPAFRRYRLAHARAFKQKYVCSAIRGRDFDFTQIMIQVLRRFHIIVPDNRYRTLAWMWYRPAAMRSYVQADVGSTLEQLKNQGIKLAIVSNTCVPPHCLDQHLEWVNLLQYFPIRVYSSTTLYRTPHRKIFDVALDQLGVAPGRAIFVGDQLQTDIRGARRVGMRTIWMPASPRTRTTRRRRADFVIRRIADVPRLLPEVRFMNWRSA